MPLKGIQNVGNNCYLNALLQCLSTFKGFQQMPKSAAAESSVSGTIDKSILNMKFLSIQMQSFFFRFFLT